MAARITNKYSTDNGSSGNSDDDVDNSEMDLFIVAYKILSFFIHSVSLVRIHIRERASKQAVSKKVALCKDVVAWCFPFHQFISIFMVHMNIREPPPNSFLFFWLIHFDNMYTF